MAALNRLSQRIKENFQETTRDISLLTGNSNGHSSYFDDTKSSSLDDISKLLESRIERERLEGMKRIIANISRGRSSEMEGFFAKVVKNVVSNSVEIRKLVYIYLLRFASTNPDLLLLSINTFQKDLSDPSPLIRSMSLRVLTSIRVPVIQGIVMLGLKKLVTDRNPWVRKTVAGGLAKVYEMDTSSLSQLLPLLQTLLASPSPLTLGASLTAFLEICPDRLEILHPFYRHICNIIVDADEWGQAVALTVLTRYARVMLEKPDNAGSSDPSSALPAEEVEKPNGDDGSEDEFAGLDEDLAMLLHCIKPLFQSRNPAVVLATANAYYHLAPASHKVIGQDLLVAPILRLAGSPSNVNVEREEMAALTWDVIASMAEERPWLFKSHHSSFFLHSTISSAVQQSKLRALIALVSSDNASISIREFKQYIRLPVDGVAEEAVRAIGYCVQTQPEVAATGLSALMRLLQSRRDNLVAQAVIVLKSVILSQTQSTSYSNPNGTATTSSLPSPQRLVARLAKQLDGITNSKARASVFWLVGQFAACDVTEESTKKGLGWEGVVLWVPDILRKAVKGFASEAVIAKLQILTLTTKLLVLSPATSQLNLIAQYLFSLARYDADYDIRDRARLLHALLRGVRDEKNVAAQSDVESIPDEDEERDMGGVILRREQVKVVLLSSREVGRDTLTKQSHAEYQVGSMSRIVNKKLSGYEDLPEWTDDPTDSSLRDSELDNPLPSSTSKVQTPIPTPGGSASAYVAAPLHINLPGTGRSPGPASSTPTPFDASPAGSIPQVVKSKFQDLDAFLNSDSESEEDSESEDESAPAPPVRLTAPPRSAIVPEYDEDTSTEAETEEGTESDSEKENENARLYSGR